MDTQNSKEDNNNNQDAGVSPPSVEQQPDLKAENAPAAVPRSLDEENQNESSTQQSTHQASNMESYPEDT